MKIKTEKLHLERERLRLQAEAAESPAALAKKYGDALRGVLGRMPTDPANLPAFFENAERLFANIKTPEALHAQVIMPYLTERKGTCTCRAHWLCPIKKSKLYFCASINLLHGRM